MTCIVGRIAGGEIPAKVVDGVASLDVQPLADALFGVVRRALGAAGTTIGVNHGDATGQTVPQVHAHIVSRWPDDGTGSVHTIFPRHPTRSLADAGAAIRKAAAS